MRRERKSQREKEIEEKREKSNFFFYIICQYNLYYFNKLYVKIETKILNEL